MVGVRVLLTVNFALIVFLAAGVFYTGFRVQMYQSFDVLELLYITMNIICWAGLILSISSMCFAWMQRIFYREAYDNEPKDTIQSGAKGKFLIACAMLFLILAGGQLAIAGFGQNYMATVGEQTKSWNVSTTPD